MAPGPHRSALTASPTLPCSLHPLPCICPLSIPTMLSVHSEQLHKTGFPTVHAVVLLEGTMNLTGETQPLVEQLMMVKRMQVGGQGGALSPQRAGHAGQEGGFFWSSLGDTGFLLLCGGSWIPVLVVLSGGVALPSHLPSLVLAQESGRCLCCLALTCWIPKGQETAVGWAPSSCSPLGLPTAYPHPAVCSGDLESLLRGAHRVS